MLSVINAVPAAFSYLNSVIITLLAARTKLMQLSADIFSNYMNRKINMQRTAVWNDFLGEN